MNNNFIIISKDSDIQHHGILGQKWGIRRFQNKDGTLTSAGKGRYKDSNDSQKKINDDNAIVDRVRAYKSDIDSVSSTLKKMGDDIRKDYDDICKLAEREANAAVKTQAFKNDIDKELFDLFEYDCSDERSFNEERAYAVYNVLNNKRDKYAPETCKRLSKLDESINAYNDLSKKEVKKIVDSLGAQSVSGIKPSYEKYESVVSKMIHENAESNWIFYLSRNAGDYLFDDIDCLSDPSIYSMGEYNKKHRT